MKELVEQVNKIFGDLNGKLVCDIGCNDGTLLNFFKEKKCDTLELNLLVQPEAQKNHPSAQSFFDINSAKKIISEFGYPEIITFTNVFAHIKTYKWLLKH